MLKNSLFLIFLMFPIITYAACSQYDYDCIKTQNEHLEILKDRMLELQKQRNVMAHQQSPDILFKPIERKNILPNLNSSKSVTSIEKTDNAIPPLGIPK